MRTLLAAAPLCLLLTLTGCGLSDRPPRAPSETSAAFVEADHAAIMRASRSRPTTTTTTLKISGGTVPAAPTRRPSLATTVVRRAAPPTLAPTAPKPAVVPVGPCGGWRDLVARYFPADQVSYACRVLMRESGGSPSAVNPTPVRIVRPNGRVEYAHATGLMQILPDGSRDPEENMRQAIAKWRARGWQPWGG